MTIDTTLKFRGAQGVRVLGTPEAPLFVAADVCRILGIKDHHQAVKNMPKSCQGGMYSVPTPSGVQDMLTVTEPGLYRLIMKSRKKEADEFQEWVTAEVLPAIRKTGAYMSQPVMPALPPATDLPAMFELMAHALRANTGLNEMLSAILPRQEYGSISPASGQPRTRLSRGYWTSRWPRDMRTQAFLVQEQRQLVMQELLDELQGGLMNRFGMIG